MASTFSMYPSPPSPSASPPSGGYEALTTRPKNAPIATHHTPLYPSFDDTSGPAQAAGMATNAVEAQLSLPKTQQQDPRASEWQSNSRQAQVETMYNELGQRPEQHDGQQELLTPEELQRRQRQIEGDMRVYQQRLDYVAQALAGETPHQIHGRRKRGEERLEREEKRQLAVETRVQHQIERLREREERRAKVCSRPHRTSRSSSPSGRQGTEANPSDPAVDDNLNDGKAA
ncbi:hypothetical protein BBJ28_00004731 [Nothophytophthora sp. Chile5]|nr:hypothetical protein BBJ28_00004731 [Nothophytophthora sp. Chile5]